jgi:hypothetical protein
VQYLYAAYSMGGPQVPEHDRATVLGWQSTILGTAKEEMGHLITVQNILRLVGGPLNFQREDFPWDSDITPFPFTLEPLSTEVLAKYIVAESRTDWGSAATPEEKAEIEAAATASAGREVKPVGVLYAYMIALLREKSVVPDSVFLADTLPYQASWDEWGRAYGGPVEAPQQGTRPDLLIGTGYSRDKAVAALQQVADQGEAPSEDYDIGETSHFAKFLAVWRGFKAMNPVPVRPLAVNPIVPFDPDLPNLSSRGLAAALAEKAPLTEIRDPITAKWGLLCNLRYRVLMNYLSHSLSLSGPELAQPPQNPRGLLVHSTFAEMYNLRALSSILVQLPMGGADIGLRAGPPFQMPFTLSLPADESARWHFHLDLLQGAAGVIEALLQTAAGTQRSYLLTLQASDAETMVAIRTILDPCRQSRRR